MSNRKVIITSDQVAVKLGELVEKIAEESITKTGRFTIGVSGGSLVRLFSEGVKDITTDWSKWVIFFCDERIVPEDSPDSTFGAYKNIIGPNFPVKETQFVWIDPSLSAEEAAQDYKKKLEKYFTPGNFPRFNLLLLGVGEDGHTCSLFPNHPLLSEKELWVAPITDSPKPPPSRITLTLPVVNNAENCIFSCVGLGKADIIKLLLVDNCDLPANHVKPHNGCVYWILDGSASSLMEKV